MTGLSVTPSFEWAVTTNSDNVVKLWNLKNPKKPTKHKLARHETTITTVALTPNGNQVILGFEDGFLRFHSTNLANHNYHELKAHKSQITSLFVSADSGWILAGTEDGSVKLVNLITFDYYKLKGHNREIVSLSLSKDGKKALTASKKEVIIWDLTNPRKPISYRLKDCTKITSACLSPDGKIALIGCADAIARLVETEHLENLETRIPYELKGHTAPILTVVLANDKYAFTGSRDKTVRIWDIPASVANLNTPSILGNATRCCSENPLHVAVQDGDATLVELFLGYESHRTTPLLIATREGQTHIVDLLIKYHDKTNEPYESTEIPLLTAIQKGYPEIVNLFLEAGADVNETCSNGKTHLITAISDNHLQVATLLINHGAKVNKISKTDERPLCVAAQNGQTEIVERLLEAGANVNKTCSNGRTPLFLAALHDHPRVVDLLIRHKAKVNKASIKGETPLSAAQSLITKGQHSNLKYLQGHHQEVIDLLKQAGASSGVALNDNERMSLLKKKIEEKQKLQKTRKRLL